MISESNSSNPSFELVKSIFPWALICLDSSSREIWNITRNHVLSISIWELTSLVRGGGDLYHVCIADVALAVLLIVVVPICRAWPQWSFIKPETLVRCYYLFCPSSSWPVSSWRSYIWTIKLGDVICWISKDDLSVSVYGHCRQVSLLLKCLLPLLVYGQSYALLYCFLSSSYSLL